MIRRIHQFSKCRKYRFTLWREILPDLFEGISSKQSGFVQFIGLNPSTADEVVNDNTVSKCIAWTKQWGYGAMCMTNAFAFRATDPADMLSQADPIGDGNDTWLNAIAIDASIIVPCWGNDGAHMNRSETMLQYLPAEKLRCFGVTKQGHPRHPLYMANRAELLPWPTNKCCWRDHDDDGKCDKHR